MHIGHFEAGMDFKGVPQTKKQKKEMCEVPQDIHTRPKEWSTSKKIQSKCKKNNNQTLSEHAAWLANENGTSRSPLKPS